MSEHRALVRWTQAGGSFVASQYSRAHQWSFDGGLSIPASAAPGNVAGPYADPTAVDPEEAFVAAVSSCHMLFFLYLAARAGFEVASYEDDAVGHLTADAAGRKWMSLVELAPRVAYVPGRAPAAAREAALHHESHEQCYIANSVRTEIRVLPAPAPALA